MDLFKLFLRLNRDSAQPGRPFTDQHVFAQCHVFIEQLHIHARREFEVIEFDPFPQRDLGYDTLHTINLFVSKEIGSNRSDATPVELAE